MSSEEEENVEIIENGEINETDPVFRTVAEADVSLDEMMSLACRQGKLDIVELLLESGAHVDYRNKAGNTPLLEACSQGHVDVARYLLDHQANINAPTETTSDSALTWACTLGNEAIVELLLSKSADVEHRTKDGCTALMFAALAGHVKVATMLLDHGAEINVESDSNKDSPLTFACWKGHCDVVELLLERAANIEHRTKEGFTPLMFAALGGHTDVAAKLLERGAKVNVPSGSNNDIPLTSACWKGHHDVVKLLLEYNSNIEHRTKDGCTPLMLAAREGHYSVAKLILDSKAEVNVPSGSENNIPLTLACWKGHTVVVELLLDHKSNIEHRNKAGCTPLMLAAREGHIDTTKLLLSRGAEINKPSGSNDDTPLTLACWKGHKEVVELLLRHNSKVDHQTKTGCTPLMEATREGHVAVAEKLIIHGADVELPDNYGQSPLFMACWKGHRDVAELLLENSANRDCRTKTGITPLFQACRENHVDVVELLLDYGASVNAPFPNSRENPLTLAAEKGHCELVTLLLDRGANVECHTKKGCTPFNLSCKEGHLSIAIALFKKGADTEACDSRNNTPLVAGMKNGHVEVCEWLLTVVNHLPSEEQAQKCLVAPIEEKDKHDDIMLGRTKCYDIVTKTKKAREQKAHIATEIFLKELEHEKEREENRKKKAAAKRRDKRRKKKAAKESEQQANVTVSEELPSENRPQESPDQESDQETVESSGPETDRSSTQTSALDSRDTQASIEADSCLDSNSDGINNHTVCNNHILKSETSSKVLSGRTKLTRAKRQLDDKVGVKTIKDEEKLHIRGAAFAEPDHNSNSSKDHVLQKKNVSTFNQNKEKRKSGSFNERQLFSDWENPEKPKKIESTKIVDEKPVKLILDEQTMSRNCENQVENGENKRKHSSIESPNALIKNNSRKPEGYSHGMNINGVKEENCRNVKESTSASVMNQGKVKTEKERSPVPVSMGHTTSNSAVTSTIISTSSISTSSDNRTIHSVHSPRSKQHSHNILRTEDNWKEVTRTANNKTMMIQLVAPNALCGRVIGRGGTKINSITEESGAQITIGKPETKGIGDRTITIKGSTKSVQRAKFLVTQALNTPSTSVQSSSSTTTTTVAVANSENGMIVTSTAVVVVNNFPAVPSAASDWPTIMQANKSLHSQVNPKPVSKTTVTADEGIKKQPVSGLVGNHQQVKSDSLPKQDTTESSFSNGNSVTVPTPITVTQSIHTSEGTAQTTTVWSSKSAWKPYRPTTQSVGLCTSAVKTCSSSSTTSTSITTPLSTSSSVKKHSDTDIPSPLVVDKIKADFPVGVEARPSYSGVIRGPEAGVSQGQKESPLPKLSTATSPPVSTVGNTTRAVSTVDQRSSLAPVAVASSVDVVSSMPFGVIGANKPQSIECVSLSSTLPVNSFGVIGDGAGNMASFSDPEVKCHNESSLASTPPLQIKSASLPSANEKNRSKFPCYSPWASQPPGIKEIGGNEFSSSGNKFQGSLPGMELFSESNSLFSGPLTSYPWSSGEDTNLDKTRSISWSEQASYRDDQSLSQSLPKKDTSPVTPKVSSDASVELHSDAPAFKPLSAGSIWSPVGSQPLGTALTVVCDEETSDKQGWNNSDSTSSSRSSSRQELSSIMDVGDSASGNGVWNSSAFTDDLTPTPQVNNIEFNPSLRGQGVSTSTHWSGNRGAFSAPSSPSLQRTQSDSEVVLPGQPAVDDMAVRTWPVKQKSPRSVSLSEQPLNWSANNQGHRRANSEICRDGVNENRMPSHSWPYSPSQTQLPAPQHSYPPGLMPGTRDSWRKNSSSSSVSQTVTSSCFDLGQTLQWLGLEKYLHVFQERNISGNHVTELTEEDLKNLGLPKGPRLKLLHAIRHGSRWNAVNSLSRPNSGFVNQADSQGGPTVNSLSRPNSGYVNQADSQGGPTVNSLSRPNSGFVNQADSQGGPTVKSSVLKKPKADPVLASHNHVLPHHQDSHLSPSGRKKHIPNQSVQQIPPGVHNNQSLLTQLPPGRVYHPSAPIPSLNHEHANSLPPRPHSASGSLIGPGQGFVSVSVGSHGDQMLPYVATGNHLPFSQPQAPVYYTGAGYYYYYPQQ